MPSAARRLPVPAAETSPAALTALIERARHLTALGQETEAKNVYLSLLARDPAHLEALLEFGRLAFAGNYRAAARTAHEQAVRCHPGHVGARINLGNILFDFSEHEAAGEQFKAALAIEPAMPEAHRGLARVLTALGDIDAADAHWRQSFCGQAIAVQRYRGLAPAMPVNVLVLVSARGGNIPLRHILDDRIFAVTALYAEFYDPALPLPSHDLLFNAIGDADLCGPALANAAIIAAHTSARVINPPVRVAPTGRAENAARLGGVPGVRAPCIQLRSRAQLADDDLKFPLLLRAPGFHTGQHFRLVADPAGLAEACAALPGESLLEIEYLDARGADGLARKYRVMFIDGALYPVHLAVSADWKVHYFSAAMKDDAAFREEERRFLADMQGVLGPRVMAALADVARTLGLDYGGIDFAVGADGSLLAFEANATMVLNPPDPDPIWDYRRAPIEAALNAARRMLLGC